MKKSKFVKLVSGIVAFVMILSLLSPLSVSANTQQAKPFKPTAQNESTMQLKAAIAEQLNVLEGGASLHKDLQGLTGNGQVSVIVHLSQKPVALEKGIKELAGKKFTSSEAAQVKAEVKTQQTFVIKEMNAKNISFKQGFTFDTVLNGFAATVKADDLTKLLTIKGVTLVEPDAIVSASQESKAFTTTTSPDLVKNDKIEPAMNTSISFLGIEKLWNEGYEGQGIKVAVLDTGIDKEHPEFKGVYVSGKNFVHQVVGADYARPRSDDDASETSPLDRPATKPEFNANGSSFTHLTAHMWRGQLRQLEITNLELKESHQK
ncbi:protease inhibitor I9 family protein [Paenisporosarcina sp. TG20]|uniref:protease inhibitor I9 family protein n=1 Tax=Paenisporosarcina sp. TG20 TaxID=1211706 RepID=UPI00031D2782|nr:protease inhibitor I9 family protein [Paenisporosarcina sp. TG20]